MTLILILGMVAVALLMRPLYALSANASLNRAVDQEIREFPVGAGVHLYRDGAVGLDPAGYLKPFEPGDRFAGFAYEECDNSGGAAGDVKCRVQTLGDWTLPITGIAAAHAGRAVFAAADDAFALTGHPDAFVGRVVHVEDGLALVRKRWWNEQPANGEGCAYQVIAGPESFEATGAASSTKFHPAGLAAKSILGLGVSPLAAEGGGADLSFDAVAEVALASIRGVNATYPVAKGITFEAELVVADKGDNAALDIDWGLGSALTTNSEASIDHADMVHLAAFHMDGNSDNILAQSDNDVTDVAPVDTTIDNDSTTDVAKRFKIVVRPTGLVEFWINEARVLASTAFAVGAAALLAPFINMEKTSDDTTAQILVKKARVAGGSSL